MSRATDTPSPETSSARPTGGGATIPSGKVVCPFCGSVNDRPAHDYDNSGCPKCSMADTPETRQATRARLGPWFVRQTRNPAAPGMKFDTLMALVKRGQVTAQSIVRGPTTNQFWRFAAQVKGLSREFGVCYNCATPVDKAATICPQCNRMQEPPANPDVLLENAPAATAPSAAPASAATATVHREIKPPPAAPQPTPAPAVATMPSLATSAAAVATAEPRPQRRPSPVPRREHAPVARDEAPQRTDLLAPARPRSAPRQRTADDGILSARDLATAFQLDFKPESRRGAGGLKRIAMAVVLLAVSGGAIVLMMNPDYRDKAHVWLSEQSTAVRGLVTGRAKPAPTPARVETAPAPVAPKSGGAVAALPATRPSPEVAFPIPPRPVDPGPEAIAAKSALPETQPAPAAAPDTKPVAQQQQQTPAPSAQVTVAPVPSAPKAEPTTRNQQPQQAKDNAKEQPVSKVAAAPVDAAKASEQAIALWRQALDAEARRDYAKAVEHYEAIKKLPKSTWPAGLEINLSLAKKRVK